MENSNINIFVKEGWNTVAQVPVFNDIGYGYHRWAGGIKAGIKYTIEIYDFGGRQAQDFTVTMYSGRSKTTLSNARILA